MIKNDNQTVEKLIAKLLELTQTSKIAWDRIPNYFNSNKNEPLKNKVIHAHQYFYSPINGNELKEYCSFCSRIEDGVVSILTYAKGGRERYILGIQCDSLSSVVDINSEDQYQNQLAGLLSVIEAKKDGITSLIEAIFNM